MKRFSQTVVQIKNADGEFEPIAALRGLSSYELAVQNGFEGTEDEWLETMLSDGWVGKYQELETKKVNRSEVYTSKQTDELLKGFDADAKEYAESAAAISTYLALASNVNEDMVNAALGMNNEEYIKGVGMALAMYAKFKDPTIVINDTLLNLSKCDTLANITTDVTNELNTSITLRRLFTVNHYARNKGIIDNAYGVICSETVLPTITFDNSAYTCRYGELYASGEYEPGMWVEYTSQNASSYETLTSNESFPTNGSRFMMFRYVYASGKSKVGVKGNTGEIRYASELNTTMYYNNYHCEVIDVSDFESIQLVLHTNEVWSIDNSNLVINDVIFTDFNPYNGEDEE